jgi:dTDP-4-amino-4,6-dideoxygalactose transaminase
MLMNDGISDWPQWPQVDARTMETLSASLIARRWSISGLRSAYASFLTRVEVEFARLIGRKHCVTTCNGSSAIVIALQALGIGPGHRVLVPATTWVGCATAVHRVGASPVFMEGDENSPCMNPDIAQDIDPNSIDAILAVHLYSSHDDVDRLRRWAPRAVIVEDCSHCHTAIDKRGRTLGTLGDISIFSFQATKILTCGEGGAALTDDSSLAARLAALRADSRRARLGEYSESDLEPAGLVHGANFALSELHAAVLYDQMVRLAAQSTARAHGVRVLADRLQGTSLRIVGDEPAIRCGSFYGLLVLGVRDAVGTHADIRHILQRVKEISGAHCQEVYPPVPESPLYLPHTDGLYRASRSSRYPYPRALGWHREGLVIPHHLMLAEPDQIVRLGDALLDCASPVKAQIRAVHRHGARLPSITVIILTHGRPERLTRALESVVRQDYGGPLRVLVFGDNAPYVGEITRSFTGKLLIESLSVNGWDPRPDQSTFERVALLRNMALDLVETSLVCFLDDDNTWEPNHVTSLVEAMRATGAPVAHSWRRLLREDGSEWIPDDFPWLPPGPASHAVFETYLRHGVFSYEDSIVRDVASLCVAEGDIGMVDLGEWMFERTVLNIVGFDSIVTPADLAARVGEDDKLLSRLRTLGIPVACSTTPTLLYRLGGFSNAPEASIS